MGAPTTDSPTRSNEILVGGLVGFRSRHFTVFAVFQAKHSKRLDSVNPLKK
jgi:hypothetical protein